MIKRVIAFYFLCFSCFAFANLELGVGYKSNKIDDAPKRSNGLELSLGKKYFFNEN